MKSFWLRFQQDPLTGLLVLGLWLLPISNAVGQVPLYLASVIYLVQALRKKAPVCRRTQGFLIAFALIILVSLTYAVTPEMGISKLNRLLIFPLAGAAMAAGLKGSDPTEKILKLGTAFVVGVCLRGVYDLIKFPLEVAGGELFEDVGNMTSPQFYLVGIVLFLGLRAYRPERFSRWFWLCLPLLLCGFLMHQKRGVWLAGMATIGLWTVWMRYWKTLSAMALMAGCALMLPFVQTRLSRLTEVVDTNHGGRSTLWVHVAPRILPRYPLGMGYNGSRYEDFREVLPADIHLEVGLRHLHNNFLQIRLELGWHGVVLWTVWMGFVLWTGFRRRPREEAALRHCMAFALLALLLNGLVEYNFGDSEILKAYLILFGLLDATERLGDNPKST